jgi:hypothetical protein
LGRVATLLIMAVGSTMLTLTLTKPMLERFSR